MTKLELVDGDLVEECQFPLTLTESTSNLNHIKNILDSNFETEGTLLDNKMLEILDCDSAKGSFA